ncbi:MAG: chemotaxis protein CheW [Deltaproteobacteria bacterium]|nr:chemotaxis protein CheW [Deltaproteobacteria bacterium]
MDNTQHDNSFLTFRVGPYYLAVPAVDAEAIITMPKIRSVPLTPESVAGVFSHRGKITVVISLKRKFGMIESDDWLDDQLIISKISTGLTAFKVDEVLDIIPASELKFSSLPTMGMITAFDRFALNHDKIILHTDFDLLFRLEDSKELAESLKRVTGVLKPKSDLDKQELEENNSNSEENPQTTLGKKEEKENMIHSTSSDSSKDRDKALSIDTENDLKQGFETAGKKVLLEHGVKSPRKAIPYKDRHFHRNTQMMSHRLAPKGETADKQPKLTLWFAACGILILSILFVSVIWLWPDNDQHLRIASISEKPETNKNRAISTQPSDLSQNTFTDATLNKLVDTVSVLEDTGDETVKSEEPDDTEQLQSNTVAKISEAVEKNNADSSISAENKEVLRIETEDFTMTIERPQSLNAETRSKLEQKSILLDEKSQILKTEKKQPLNTERTHPERKDVTSSMPIAAERTEIIHIVVKGDTLWDISATYLGNPFRYPELAKLSRINDPDLIYPGDMIRITKKN